MIINEPSTLWELLDWRWRVEVAVTLSVDRGRGRCICVMGLRSIAGSGIAGCSSRSGLWLMSLSPDRKEPYRSPDDPSAAASVGSVVNAGKAFSEPCPRSHPVRGFSFFCPVSTFFSFFLFCWRSSLLGVSVWWMMGRAFVNGGAAWGLEAFHRSVKRPFLWPR